MAAGGTATPADRILVSSNTTPSWGQLTDAMVAAGAGIAAAKLFAGGTGNRVLRTTDGTNPIWGQVGTPDIAALSLSQAAGIAIGPSANQSWSSTVAFQPVNQCTVTLTGCLASSYYLVFGAFGATHSVANGRNQARIWCATSGAMLGWFSPSMGNATAGLQFAHSIVAFGAVSVSGSITFELHAAPSTASRSSAPRAMPSCSRTPRRTPTGTRRRPSCRPGPCRSSRRTTPAGRLERRLSRRPKIASGSRSSPSGRRPTRRSRRSRS
jgi:hypothetical protein